MSFPAHADTDARVGVRAGDAAEVSRQVHDGHKHDDARIDPHKPLTTKVTVGASAGARLPLPVGKAPEIKVQGSRTFDLASLFRRKTQAPAAPATARPSTRKPQVIPGAPPVVAAASAAVQSASAPQASTAPVAMVAPAPAPAPRQSPILPLAGVLGGAGVLAAAGWAAVHTGLAAKAGHALKTFHRPRIRAEGRMGGSRVEKPEFDSSAPPAIGFIVSPGRAKVTLTFDTDVSGDAA